MQPKQVQVRNAGHAQSPALECGWPPAYACPTIWKSGTHRDKDHKHLDQPLGETPNARFRRLQGWLDDSSDAGGHLVLKLENVLQRAVETVGPEMRARYGINQLSSDADPLARLAN